ncbi:MAG: cupin domain-containing protein [Bdellovibrionales bacterium]
MIVRRWLAPRAPNKKQIQLLFEKDHLDFFEENFDPGIEIPDHRHPFDEIRMIVEGELLYNIGGNKLLLRQGDQIVIPSNTKHSKKVQGTNKCISICAYKAY